MRHRKTVKKLGRTASHRKAMVSNVVCSLFEHKRIKTTETKAKEVRGAADKLITFAKSGTLADRRQVLRSIHDKAVVKTLFDEIAPTFKDRNGGYTRVVKVGRRRGDGAEMAILELVGYEGVILEKERSKEETKSARDEQKEKQVESKEEAAAEQ